MGDTPSKCLCDDCSGLCCRYFALPIDNPDEAKDFENIRWYLLHENVTIFVEKGQWYIGVANRCKMLRADNRCGIYLTRPPICRGYSTENCDYHGGEYEFEHLFTSAEQIERYAKETLAKQRAEKREKAAKKAKAAEAKKPAVDLVQLADKLTRTMANQPPPPVEGNARVLKLPLL